MNRILIAEDEGKIASFIEKGLKANGFATTIAQNGDEATFLARNYDFDLLVLDLNLPDKSGWIVLEELRGQGYQVPIIILSVYKDVRDKVAGLENGANDYVTKPFCFNELLARLRLRLHDNHVPVTKEEMVLSAGDILLDVRKRQVRKGNCTVELSAREFILIEAFLRHPEQVMSREQLLSYVWGYDYSPGSNVVDVYIGYLRKKLGSDFIETVRGMGYRLQTNIKNLG